MVEQYLEQERGILITPEYEIRREYPKSRIFKSEFSSGIVLKQVGDKAEALMTTVYSGVEEEEPECTITRVDTSKYTQSYRKYRVNEQI